MNYDSNTPRICHRLFFDEFKDGYGVLCSLFAILDEDVCPTGWHVLSDDDWMEMEPYLRIPATALTKNEDPQSHLLVPSMKDYDFWTGTNTTGFTAVPSGDKESKTGFSNVGNSAAWLTTTQASGFSSFIGRTMTDWEDYIGSGVYCERGGYSVRCLKG